MITIGDAVTPPSVIKRNQNKNQLKYDMAFFDIMIPEKGIIRVHAFECN